jgi:putative effector of murein hydrolase
MNAAVSALGLRMFAARRVLEANWRPVVGGGGCGAALSLVGTAWASGRAQLPPQLGLALVHRSVMSALGMAGAAQLGASPHLAVASIILTGVYGASLGPPLLNALGLAPKAAAEGEAADGHVCEEHAVARGVAMGQSAHAIGTASLVARGESAAAAVAAVALCVAGVVHTALLSIPATQRLVHALVLGRTQPAASSSATAFK